MSVTRAAVLKHKEENFGFALFCYALLVMSVQHQQSEWVECRYSISFMTLYQCEWLDETNECEHHFALVSKDAFCLPVNLFLLFYLKYCVPLVYTNWYETIWGGHNFFSIVCVTCIDLCANENQSENANIQISKSLPCNVLVK